MMKPIAESPWKQRLLFFLAGGIFAFLCMIIALKWMDIVPYTAFDLQPDWLKTLKNVVDWLPWVAFVGVLVLRSVKKDRRIRVGFHFLGTAAPIVILLSWMLLGGHIINLIHRQDFNAELWRTQDKVEHDISWPPRLCMVDNLMSSGKLNGLTESQVVQLLGPPHDKSFPGGAKNCDIHYHLGPERGFMRIDSEWLFITFGDNGKVNRSWLYKD